MSVFLVIGYTELPKLKAQVQATYPTPKSYLLTDTTFFVEDDGTTQSVAEKLTIADGKLGAQAVVIAVESQFGWIRRDFWEWIRPRLAAKPNG